MSSDHAQNPLQPNPASQQQDIDVVVPSLIADMGEEPTARFMEFFIANIPNANTREAYARAIYGFFNWLDERGTKDLYDIETLDIAAWVREQEKNYTPATVQQRLAAVKSLLTWFVRHQLLAVSPADTIKAVRERLHHGKTPVLSSSSARALLDSIPTQKTVNGILVVIPAGLRDLALISLMIYTFARVSAAVQLNLGDVTEKDNRLWVRLREKGGKIKSMPCHHTLEAHLRAYREYLATLNVDDANSPLFRSFDRSRQLTKRRLHRTECWYMVRRRAKKAGISEDICNHTFRGTGITSYLKNENSRLELAQQMAGHADPKTTKLYDRRDEEVSLDEVERIDI